MNVIEHNKMVPDTYIQLVEDVDDAGDGIVIVKDTEDGNIYLLNFYECAEDYQLYEISEVEKLIKKAKKEHLKYKLNHLIGREKRQ